MARSPGGIPTKGLAFVALVLALVLVPQPAAASLPPLITATVHFDVPGRDLIPGVAAFRAACDVTASGEALSLLDNGTARTTISASPSACSMVLILFGIEVGIPTINTTPIGRSSYYIPGLSLPTLGLADVSLDLQSAMDSSSAVADPGVASVDVENVTWSTWGVQRLVVHGAHGYGSTIASTVNTTFAYALALGLTVYVAGIQVYHTSLTEFGRYAGTPALATPISVDLLPHSLTLGAARTVKDTTATLNWTGTVDSDLDHLELWLTDGTTNLSYRIADRVTSAMSVSLEPRTRYTAWIVAVDRSGQSTSSGTVTFRTLATSVTPPPTNTPLYTETQANIIVIATFAFLALLAAGVAYGFGKTRGRV